MARISDYDGTDFITIENGRIFWDGYFYNNEGHITLVEYSNFNTSLDDFINKYGRSADTTYEEYGNQSTQYITKEGEDNNTTEYMNILLDSWVNDANPISEVEISENTPDGFYFLI